MVALQFTVPALIGALIALKFNMTPLAIAVVARVPHTLVAVPHNLNMAFGLLPALVI